MENLDYALQYLEMGWNPMPIDNKTKKPLAKWKRYQQEELTHEQVEAWWTEWPTAAVGIITGEISGLVVVDCDNEAAAKYVEDKGISSVVRQRTKRGMHLLFAHPGTTVRNTVRWQGVEGLDIRGDGGYIKVHPSDGYIWDLPAGTDMSHMAHELKSWGYAEVTEDVKLDEPKEPIPDAATEGSRNETITRYTGAIIQERDDLWGQDILDLVWEKNKAICQPPLGKEEVLTIVRSVMGLHKRNNPDEFNEKGERILATLDDRDRAVRDKMQLLYLHDAIVYTDDPKPREFLVDKIIPAGLPGVLASSGGVGKTYMLMDLACKVAFGTPHDDPRFMGHPVKKFGKVVMFLYEDDADELNRRMQHIDPGMRRGLAPGNLMMLSIPELDKPINLGTKKFDTPIFTRDADEWRDVLLGIDDLALVVFDPLQSFFEWRFDEDNVAADRALKWAQSIATRTGASVIFTHHLRKEDMGNSPTTPQGAVAKIRGASNIVNSSRFAIPIWRPNEDVQEEVIDKLMEKNPSRYSHLENNSLFMTGLGKENFGGDTSTHWLVRDSITGLLIDATGDVEGEARAVAKPASTNDLVIKALGSVPRKFTTSEIADMLGKSERTVNAAMRDLMDRSRVKRTGRGKYEWLGHHPDFLTTKNWAYRFIESALKEPEKHHQFTENLEEGLVSHSLIGKYCTGQTKALLWRECLRVLESDGLIQTVTRNGKQGKAMHFASLV